MKAFIKETWLTKAFREFEKERYKIYNHERYLKRKARLVRKIANQ